ncbi:MAG TPA: enolase C-terminal domain-like protein [Limnochordia bacterium]|nr:enolase C-terminal domain-like protein [Limnochordia bacterium]
MDLSVKRVERIWVDVPYREVPARNMVRELPHWTLFELCKVELACGVTGVGETMVYYTWGTVSDAAVARVQGKNAAELMWDDSLGAGLQIALFDAVGKALGVPCHRLMGRKVRERAFVSWWDIDMPGEDWLAECREAVAQGYTNFKTKARPWFDLDDQIKLLSAELPVWFELDLDFNGMLNNTSTATRLLTEIERYPQVAIYETPIPQGDVLGNKFLRSQTRVPIAMHYGQPPILTALREDICDGFVVGGGASALMRQATVCAMADKVFWLQLVGTAVTAAWSLQVAAVCSHARWPAVNCHQLYAHSLVKGGLPVHDGTAAIPEGPGLGVELDWDVIERFRIEPKAKPYPHPGLLLAIRWPSGGTSYYTHTQQYWDDFLGGRLPVFAKGVRLEHVADDGSAEWRELQQRAQAGGVHTGAVR